MDMFVIEIENDQVIVRDLWSTSDSTPSTDTSQDFQIKKQTLGTNSLEVTFNRKLNTGDSKDKTLSKGQSYSWGYAYHTGEEKMVSKHSRAGQATVLFGSTSADTTTSTTGNSSSSQE